jgi:P4 family phage/plasmid primase-like protien
MSIRYYKSKNVAIAALNKLGHGLLANRQITKYFVVNSYHDLLHIIDTNEVKDFYEFISASQHVPFFFDIEIYKNSSESSKYFDNPDFIIDTCIENVQNLFSTEFQFQTILLSSHSENKKSFHLIVRVFSDLESQEILFENVSVLKDLYKQFQLDQFKDSNNKHLIDPSVYREGLFRTIHSSKSGENRPLVKCNGTNCQDIFTFVGYHSDNYTIFDNNTDSAQNFGTAENIVDCTGDSNVIVNIPENLDDNDKDIIKKFVTKEYHHYPNKVRDIFIDTDHNCIIVALTERYCPLLSREHKNNNQYIVIDTSSAKQKCHDTVCNENKTNEIKLENYPKELNEIIKKCLKVNKQEMELIDKAIQDCKTYITENFDKDIQEVSFDRTEMIFRGDVSNRNLVHLLEGTCPECNVEHQIGDNGYCLKCKICNSIFPKNQLIPIDQKYKNLQTFWTNFQIGTINNVINIYQNSGEEDFSCDIQLDNNIFKSKKLTTLFNQILDGHKITKFAEIMHVLNKNFVYTKNNWYFFNGSIWKLDDDNLHFKKNILDITSHFNKISQYYESKTSKESAIQLIKNIKNLINKINRPGFKDDVIKEAKMFYNDPEFMYKLNSKKHLLPFTNGVYDLLANKFRPTQKDDYVNLTVNFDYIEEENQDVHTFLEQVLPNPLVRDFVLKKMSDCLNGDIPNTTFLMFIGDTGANGKSQLLNLMKLAMGEFGEKVEVTLLTRKRNNANEANTEKIKLMNKRFAFLSEPEDGEKINIGLLKELTGSEEIVARGLYQESMSFVMEAKLFLACNELPEIKGEDTALWRRIRAVDFPSRFVDEPQEPGEYKIDRTLPSKMREDISWRQTFVKILLEYFYKDNIKEPNEVKVKTNEYRQENNEFFAWLDENVVYSDDPSDYVELKTICELYLNKHHLGSRISTKYKKEVEKYIKEKHKNVSWKYDQHKIKHNDELLRPRGWLNLKFI